MNDSYPVMRKGVSLVELLIVMAIIVGLAALTLPSFRAMLQDQKVTQATRMFKMQLRRPRLARLLTADLWQ